MSVPPTLSKASSLAALEDKCLEVGPATATQTEVAAPLRKKERDEEDADTAASRENKDKTAHEKRERQRREAEHGAPSRRGARILRYFDDFLLFASSEPEAPELRQRVADLMDRSAANVWAGRLSQHMDNKDWQLDPVLFAELDEADEGKVWHHALTEMAFAERVMLPRPDIFGLGRWAADAVCSGRRTGP
eukprot:jgi/Tetstr1/430353/TSEL_001978.t1